MEVNANEWKLALLLNAYINWLNDHISSLWPFIFSYILIKAVLFTISFCSIKIAMASTNNES